MSIELFLDVVFFEKVELRHLPWTLELYMKILANIHNIMSTMQSKYIDIFATCKRLHLFLMRNTFCKHDFLSYIKKLEFSLLSRRPELIFDIFVLYHIYAFYYLKELFARLEIYM
jgi:hypothetical protein